MISNQGKKYLEIKQKTNRDVRQLGPVVQFRDNFLTVDGIDEYSLTFAVPTANKQLFKLFMGGELISEGNGFDFIDVSNGRSARIKFSSIPTANIYVDYELAGARLVDKGMLSTQDDSTGFNYIANSGAEIALAGWVAKTSADATQTRFTITRNTTTPQRGDADFKIESFSGAVAGDYIAYAFTAEKGDLTKIVTLAIQDIAYASNFVSNDVRITLRDMTASVDLRSDFYFNTASTLSFPFQLSTTANYELRFVLVTPFATRKTEIWVDGISVAPQAPSVSGSVDIDYGIVATTGSWTTNSTYSVSYYRTGKFLNAVGSITLGGIPTTANLEVNIPNGWQIDTTTLVANTATPVGELTVYDSSGGTTTNKIIGKVSYGAAGSVRFYALDEAAASNHYYVQISESSPVTFASGDIITFNYRVPILGWSSNMALSSSTSNREVLVVAGGSATSSVTALTAIDFTEITDSHNAWSGTAFTAPEDGVYSFIGNLAFVSGDATRTPYLYINGAEARKFGETFASTSQAPFTFEYPMLKGQTATIRTGVTGTPSGLAVNHNILIRKVNTGSQTIGKEPKVVESWIATSGTFTAEATLSTFSTKETSTHGAYTPATAEFKAPRDGFVNASAAIKNNAAITFAVNDVIIINLYKNGTVIKAHSIRAPITSWQTQLTETTMLNIPVVAGDILQFKFSSAVSYTLINATTANRVSFSME